MLYSAKEFRKLSLGTRFQLLQDEGDYIGVRSTSSHRVYLFTYNGFYVELWQLITLNQTQWIEVQTNKNILNEYVKDVDLGELF